MRLILVMAGYDPRVPADLHETVAHRLREADQRYTNNRRALVDVLNEADRPLTIPELLERRRSLPQSSAYRNLSILEEVGAVRRVVTNDDFARYELAEDLTEHHHHLICSSCGAVEDFTVSKQLEERLTSAMTNVARRTGFQPTHHRLDLLGSCSNCS
jgi:Fe2+ or Zn2+ uptake regulation protein